MIPLVDLKSQYLAYREEIDGAIGRVLRSTTFIGGEEVDALEGELAAYTGAGHCVTCASGTDALLLSLMALGIGTGDEVITTPFTYHATAGVIALRGARPVFADIEETTCNIDWRAIEERITEKTKAIIPVSLFGQPADFAEINGIAARHGIPVIEDAAQSFGAVYGDRRSCNLSVIGCTSFFPSKPFGCYGDGGAIFTSDDALAARLTRLRHHGVDGRGDDPVIGLNSRLDAIQAAVLRVKLGHLDAELARRRQVAARYDELLGKGGQVQTPPVKEGRTSGLAQYSVRVPGRDETVAALREKGIAAAVYYPVPLHLQSRYAYLGYREGDFPVAEAISREIMSVPMSAFLEEEQQRSIAGKLLETLGVAVAG